MEEDAKIKSNRESKIFIKELFIEDIPEDRRCLFNCEYKEKCYRD